MRINDNRHTIYFNLYFLGRFHIQFYEEGNSDTLKGIML